MNATDFGRLVRRFSRLKENDLYRITSVIEFNSGEPAIS